MGISISLANLGLFIPLFCIMFTMSCSNDKLPILGHRSFDGKDTAYAEIPDFEMSDQNGSPLRLTDLRGKAHVATFFFTSCPTICPKVMRNILRISERYGNDDNLDIICFSLDHKRDSIPRLREYYDKVGFSNPRLHLLRGQEADQVKKIASSYMSTAVDDDTAPGGINHSGWILLADEKRHLRSYALGTDDKDVDRFMDDIDKLLHEK